MDSIRRDIDGMMSSLIEGQRSDVSDADSFCQPEGIYALTNAEQVAIGRLRRVAMRAGVSMDALVDELLADRWTPTPPPSETATALVSEVRGLLEKLASDIPAQMAQRMESAFLGMASTGLSSSGSVVVGSLPCVTPCTRLSEVPSYRTKRMRTPRVKL